MAAVATKLSETNPGTGISNPHLRSTSEYLQNGCRVHAFKLVGRLHDAVGPIESKVTQPRILATQHGGPLDD